MSKTSVKCHFQWWCIQEDMFLNVAATKSAQNALILKLKQLSRIKIFPLYVKWMVVGKSFFCKIYIIGPNHLCSRSWPQKLQISSYPSVERNTNIAPPLTVHQSSEWSNQRKEKVKCFPAPFALSACTQDARWTCMMAFHATFSISAKVKKMTFENGLIQTQMPNNRAIAIIDTYQYDTKTVTFT